MPRIGLTSVLVDDQARALAFYTETLGFELKRDDPAGEYRAITLTAPGDADGVELLLEPNAHPAARTFQAAMYADGIPSAIFFVDDLPREHERLEALGVNFRGPPTRSEWGHQAVLEDGCGNLIILHEDERD